MGFGLLFIGYFIAFLMSLNSYGAIFSLIGYYIIFTALQKLSDYKHSLTRCYPPLMAMMLCGLWDAAGLALTAIGSSSSLFLGNVTTVIISSVSLASTAVFNLLLFISIISFGEDTELNDVKALARTNIFITALYTVGNILVMLLKSFGDISAQILSLSVILLRIVFPLFALALIYKCFYKICAPDDVDVPERPSRFAFINNFRAAQEKRAEETAKAREEILKNRSSNSSKRKKR